MFITIPWEYYYYFIIIIILVLQMRKLSHREVEQPPTIVRIVNDGARIENQAFLNTEVWQVVVQDIRLPLFSNYSLTNLSLPLRYELPLRLCH